MDINIRYRPWLYNLMRNRGIYWGWFCFITGSGAWIIRLRHVGRVVVYHRLRDW